MSVAADLLVPPQTYLGLSSAIAARHPELSQRLRQIAEYALAHPNDMALQTVATLAERATVQPSALIRFAKAFGYDGFSEMQRVFQTRLLEQAPTYAERLRGLGQPDPSAAADPGAVLGHFVRAGIDALEHLGQDLDPAQLTRALQLLADGSIVHIMGQRRAFPVAAYLAYGLGHLGRRAHLLDGIGGTTLQQAACLGPRDTLLAVSFRPYSPDTLEVARLAKAAGLPVVVVTDGPLSPLGRLATVALQVHDAEVGSFRSLTASMCLATALVVALGQHLEKGRRGKTRSRR